MHVAWRLAPTTDSAIIMAPATDRAHSLTHPARVDGKFLRVDGRRFLVKGVAYGTFAPDATGAQFPPAWRVDQDFAQMAAAGLNTVRVYTMPSRALLDQAAEHGLRVMIGMPWAQHIAFLDDQALTRQIRRETVAHVRELSSHPAALMFAIGNEIPPGIVRWHGAARIEAFLRELYNETKSACPDALLTYVNYPPTEFLDLECFDVCSFNVYLHREENLRAYLGRLQHLAGNKPLLLAEAGADSIREGREEQARVTAMHLNAAFAEGACGAVAYSWTDEWWRGGQTVDDWAFGLVDADRQPKPALTAVSEMFRSAPFSQEARASWPKVSVVICAYNAADTLEDCLTSVEQLTYPNFEVIIVNDGSRDATPEIAGRHPGMRLISIPNGGLSAARNVGIAEATGEIVAYTDADVRVDPDWLTYLVQPMLHSSVAGVGGPNVVPPDDPFIAQCVARSPGGPTHVMLDDRIAEHIPGCNMAFRRDALLAINGFNPIYLRAGDDVDLCWRLQAKGYKLGFAPSALVWHHHRATVKAYWRQQVGYGEGEAWLEAHHPEKFAGKNVIWRGHIYSPLPFVRSLTGKRVNSGVWGTAAFPSVYSTHSHPFEFLPHSAHWLAACSLLTLVGVAGLWSDQLVAALALIGLGALGWGITLGRCAIFGRASNLENIAALNPRGLRLHRLPYRIVIAWLHFLQPLAQFHGRLRGLWSPPRLVAPERATRLPWKAVAPSFGNALTAARLLLGGATERRFWSEAWTSHDAVLTELTGTLRAVRPARAVGVDDGWRADWDVSTGVGRWGWLEMRGLIEEHSSGRVLLRMGTRFRPTKVGITLALALATVALVATKLGIALAWPSLSIACVLGVIGIFVRTAWHTTSAVSVAEQAIARVTADSGMIPLDVTPAGKRPENLARKLPRLQALQAMVVLAVAASAFAGGTWTMRDAIDRAELAARPPVKAPEPAPQVSMTDTGGLAVATNGDVFIADVRLGLIRRVRPQGAPDAMPAENILLERRKLPGALVPFAGATDVTMAANGDLLVADARNNRICRIERATGKIITVAGTGAAGFDGDDKQATQAALNAPSAVAVARNGDLYIVDTLNHRVRIVEQATGLIKTIAGDGVKGDPVVTTTVASDDASDDSEPVEGGADADPGTDHPIADAPAGNHVLADEIDADGVLIGDGGPAQAAHLSHPGDLAVAPNGDIYIADTGHNRVRRIDASTGIITTVAGDGSFGGHGDGGPATSAGLAGPAGLALVASGDRVTIYVADYFNGSVRVVDTQGAISTLGGAKRFTGPTRVAYHPSGWLYVVDASPNGVTAVVVSKPPRFRVAEGPRRIASRKVT
jgi:GT2 family glycosyltransferase/sugar lactone lactonase YvrE